MVARLAFHIRKPMLSVEDAAFNIGVEIVFCQERVERLVIVIDPSFAESASSGEQVFNALVVARHCGRGAQRSGVRNYPGAVLRLFMAKQAEPEYEFADDAYREQTPSEPRGLAKTEEVGHGRGQEKRKGNEVAHSSDWCALRAA